MRKSILGLSAFSLFALATPAMAQDEASGPISVSGSVTLTSDYRFRGFTQSGQNAAIQGGITVTHESGLYVGTWGSSINFAGNVEVDYFAGYSTDVSEGLNLDVGITYYVYPKDHNISSNILEPYVNLSTSVGPLDLKVGVNYAWSQESLGDNDAIYFHLEPSIAIPNSPFSINGHLGYASSDSFLGGADGEVLDYSIGVSATYLGLALGVSLVGTDESGSPAGADTAVVFSVGASF
jgi:uncharacterized protein (TIGR02001 family)